MFHKSNLGSFGENLSCDMNGYVPEEGDEPGEFAIDFAGNGDQEIWWKSDGFAEWRDDAIEQTKEALAALAEWRKSNG